MVGVTPISNNKIDPADYDFIISKKDFQFIRERTKIFKNDTVNEEFTL